MKKSLISASLCLFLSLTIPAHAVDFDGYYRDYVEEQAQKRNIRATMALLEQARANAGKWPQKTLEQRLEMVEEAIAKRAGRIRHNKELAKKVRRTQTLSKVIVECSKKQAQRALDAMESDYDERIVSMLEAVSKGQSGYCKSLKRGITQIPQQDPGRGFRALR